MVSLNLAAIRVKRGGVGPFFVKISFSLVDISLDVEFQSSGMLRTQITHFNPI